VNLDVEAEERDLSDAEREQLALARDSLSALLREEELKYFQRAKVKDVLLGDNNTRYFQMIANGKHRKKHIYFLEHGSEKIDTQADLQKYITEFYKKLFGEPEDSLLSLDEEEHHDFQRVSNVENSILTAPFLEKEVKEAIFQMEHNKAPGPDGFPAEFY